MSLKELGIMGTGNLFLPEEIAIVEGELKK
jgi:hypothetical protein